MASNDRKVLSVKFVAEGITDVSKQIESLGKAGVDAAQKISSAFSKTGIGKALSQQLAAMKLRLADVIAAGKRFGDSWRNVGSRLKEFQGAIGGAIKRIAELKVAAGLAGAAVIAMFKSFGSNAEAITNQASALGVTTDQYQRLSAAARDVGIEQSTLDKILAKFTIGVEDAGDEAEKAAKKNKGLSNSLEEVAVKTADGHTKIVTIRRGIQDASKEVGKFAGITQTGVEGMLAYAKSVENAGGTTEQLAKIAKDFGQKNAVQVLTLMRNLTFQFDDNARAAAGLIKPLSDLEIALGLDLDTAFDNITTNLLIMKDRLLAVFAPAMTKAVIYFTKLIQANEGTLIGYAQTINDYVIQVVDDLINILTGNPQAAKNKWLVDLVNGVQEFGKAVKYVFTEVVPDAFAKIRKYAQDAADIINNLFGTKFTGDSLLVALALGYITGAFDIFIKAGWLVVAVGGALATTFGLLSKSVGLLWLGVRGLAVSLGYVGAAVASILGLPAAVGVAIVAALIIAAGLIYIYWDDVKAYAQMTWDGIVAIVGAAGDLIVAGWKKLSTEWVTLWSKIKDADWKGLWDEAVKQSESFWTDFIASTKRDVENINEALKAIGIDLPAVWEHISNGASGIWDDIVSGATALADRLAPAWDAVKAGASELWSGVESTAKTIWDNVASIISTAASGIGKAVGDVWTAASTAISGASSGVLDTANSILGSINDALAAAGSVQGAIDLAGKLVQPFTDAKAKIEEIWTGLAPILEAKGREVADALSSPLADLKSLPTAFSEAAAGIPDALSGIASQATSIMGQLVSAVSDAANTLRSRIEEAFAGLALNINLSGIEQAFANAAQTIVSIWGEAMRAVSVQTASMVQSVSSLISYLVQYLQALRSAIASAQAQAAASGGGQKKAVGGYITGPGTGTSDSIPLWGSNGEFMIKARAVKHWGLDVLYAMNAMRMPRFAAGGLISSSMAAAVSPPSFARPLDGAAARLSPYTLVFEGQQFPGFMGPSPDALRQIGKARVLTRVASNGRAPKWRR